jgi:hypothetical protein
MIDTLPSGAPRTTRSLVRISANVDSSDTGHRLYRGHQRIFPSRPGARLYRAYQRFLTRHMRGRPPVPFHREDRLMPSDTSTDKPPVAVAREFFCEHTASKSRVFALVHQPDRIATLTAVLTCTAPEVAQDAAAVLGAAADNGPGPAIQAEIERLAALLPAAPAASFRQAVDQALTGSWPTSPTAPTYPDHDGDDDDAVSPLVADSMTRTSSEMRLAGLSGPVVQIVRLQELHVHDVDRLLRAATADDWTPDDEDDRDPDDPQDVLNAAMWLADHSSVIPGTDTVTEAAQGSLLLADRGDEVSDWSSRPVKITFGTGWRLRETLDEKPDQPDFAALYPLDDDEEDEGWLLTPRTAALLHSELCSLADAAHDDLDEYGDTPVDPDSNEAWQLFDRLPRLCWRQDATWRRNMVRAFDDLIADLESGAYLMPRCNAEELALHLAIEDARATVDDMPELVAEITEGLPVHQDDLDLEACSELLFQDHDIMMLYADWAKGIEDPASELNQYQGIGDLRPDHWFEPFLNVEPRKRT